jgi:hypothetical protein
LEELQEFPHTCCAIFTNIVLLSHDGERSLQDVMQLLLAENLLLLLLYLLTVVCPPCLYLQTNKMSYHKCSHLLSPCSPLNF